MQNRKPMVLVFAGPNGSGKSTSKSFFSIVGEYTNADDVVSATGMTNLEAAREVDDRRYSAIAQRKDFSFETVLSSEYKMNLLRAAKDAGYFIKCVFVLTSDPKINIQRVQHRVLDGGHDVDAEKIVSRYYGAISNIPELLKLCDILHIYDNTENLYRIVRKHKEDFTIFPNKFWSMEDISRLLFGKYRVN